VINPQDINFELTIPLCNAILYKLVVSM